MFKVHVYVHSVCNGNSLLRGCLIGLEKLCAAIIQGRRGFISGVQEYFYWAFCFVCHAVEFTKKVFTSDMDPWAYAL